MDIRQIECFAVVIKQGSYKKAAEDLYVTRQALSKTIKNLERELGQALVSIKDNHALPTEAGKAFYADALPVLEQYYDLENKYTQGTARSRKVQTLAIAMAHGTRLVVPNDLIDAFRLLHPDILLAVEEVTSEETTSAVEQLESEIGFVGSQPKYLARYEHKLIRQTDIFVHVPKDAPLSQTGFLSYEDVDGLPFVTFGKKNHLHRYFMEECKGRGVKPYIILTTSDSNLLIRTAVQQKAAFFGFSKDIEDYDLNEHHLLPLEDGDKAAFGTYAIKLKGAVLSSPAREFWQYLDELP